MAPISGDEWEDHFGAILKRRRKSAAKRQSPEDQVMRDVTLAVKAVRKARSERRP